MVFHGLPSCFSTIPSKASMVLGQHTYVKPQCLPTYLLLLPFSGCACAAHMIIDTLGSCTRTGRKILNEHIALAVLGTYGVIAATQMGGSKEAKPSAAGASPDAKSANMPPLNASSS